MVIFNIGNKAVRYEYPETAADITLEQYIYFIKFLLPQYSVTFVSALGLFCHSRILNPKP